MQNVFILSSGRILPVKLEPETIRSLGSKAKRLNSYSMESVLKILLWMEIPISLVFKRRMLGDMGSQIKMQPRKESQWHEAFAKVFAGFGFHYQHWLGEYRVDFFIEKLSLILECDEECHRYYESEEEQQRERQLAHGYSLVRFYPKVDWEMLVNGILKARPGKIIRIQESKTVHITEDCVK